MIPAIILAAGLGTRLRPLSALCAKPAMPVAGQPLITRILAQVARAGVTDVVINLHHLGHTITTLTGDGAHLGLRIRYSWETEILGSGGGPARAMRLVDGHRALILNGDTLTDLDLTALVRTHDESGALVTLAVVPNTEPARYGGVAADETGAFTGLVPKGAPEPSWHFVGVQVAARAAWEGVAIDRPSDSIAGVYRALAARHPGSVRVAPVMTAFDDIGTPADYLRTCLAHANAEGGSTVAPTARIADGATIARSVLWDGVEVGAGAALVDCIVLPGARVPAQTRWSRVILEPGCPATGPIVATPLG